MTIYALILGHCHHETFKITHQKVIHMDCSIGKLSTQFFALVLVIILVSKINTGLQLQKKSAALGNIKHLASTLTHLSLGHFEL